MVAFKPRGRGGMADALDLRAGSSLLTSPIVLIERRQQSEWPSFECLPKAAEIEAADKQDIGDPMRKYAAREIACPLTQPAEQETAEQNGKVLREEDCGDDGWRMGAAD